MFDLSHVNLLAILVASIAGMAVGFLWYSKFMFMDQWTKLATPQMNDGSGNPLLYVVNLAVYLAMGYALSQVMFYFDLSGIWSGLLAGAFAFLVLPEQLPLPKTYSADADGSYSQLIMAIN